MNGTDAGVGDLISLNHEFMLNSLPNIVVTVIYLVFGIIGNTAVIYVYVFKMKCLYSEKYFIPVLSMVDLITCIINCPFLITLDSMQISFVYENVCKIMTFLTHLCPTTSGILLSVIAIQRFLIICRVHGIQMTLRWKRICLFLSITLSAICSSPTLKLYGHANPYDTFKHIYPFIVLNVTSCDIQDKYKQSTILCVYNTIMLILCLCVLMLIYVCYAFVIRQSCVQNQSRAKWKSRATSVSSIRSMETSFGSKPIQSNKTNSLRSLRKSATNWHFSIMFFAVTTTSVITFVPNVLMKFLNKGDSSYIITQTFGNNNVLYRFMFNSYIINSVVNPFIYAMFDQSFRTRLIGLCRISRKE